MRKLFTAAVLALGLSIVPAAAHASTVYDLTLTDFSSAIDGTGTLTVSTPAANSGLSLYSVLGGTLTGLDITVGGHEFTLANAVNSLTNASFFNGDLSSLAYTGVADAGKVVFTLTSGSIFYNYSSTAGAYESGYISARIDPSSTSTGTSAVPEPSSIALLGSGLLGAAAFVRRRLA